MKHKHVSKRLEGIRRWITHHKNYVLAFATAVVVFILLGSTLLTGEINQTVSRTDPSGSGEISQPTVQLEASPLTGIDVAPDLARRPVTAVIVENSPEARPQSGLTSAGTVFEAIAEGGITRFVALFQEDVPDVIGPIRSLRPYFNDWVLQFDATIAHVGGSTEALAEVGPLGLKDMDEFRYAGTYWRDSSRYAPHNTYTSGSNLASLQQQLGFESSEFTPIPRKTPNGLTEPTATDITVNISGYVYNPVYTYNKGSNSYDRTVAGAPHKDRETGERVSPKVVVVLQMDQRVTDEVGHLAIATTGSNTAWVFQDGGSTKGTWQRTGRDGQISLLNAEGEEIKLNKGQIWFSILPSGNSVNY